MTDESDVTYWDLLGRVIADGIVAATADYSDDNLNRHKSHKLCGSIAGFDACRNREPRQLGELLREARRETWQTYCVIGRTEGTGDYWYWRCRELEIEWVCNVVSACLANQGLPVIIQPTYRGVMKAAEIVGVGSE